MASIINTNLNSLSAQRQLGLNASSLGTAIERLSSGLRINSAKDDAAGLAISERFAAQITGVNQAARNSNDAISLAQTAEGALGSISSNLQRIRELAVQSANGTNSASDRAALHAEATALVAENDRIANQTEFNGTKLLNGSYMGQQFQVGANREQTVTLAAIASMGSSSLGLYNGADLLTPNPTNGAASALTVTLNGPGTVFNLGTQSTDGNAISAAITAAGIPGLTAVTTGYGFGVVQTSVGATNGVAVLTINGVPININYTAGSSPAAMAARSAAAVTAINAVQASTGVSYAPGSPPSLSTFDNRNMIVSFSAGTATGAVAADFGFFTGTKTAAPMIHYQAQPGSAVTSVTIVGAGLSTSTTQVLGAGQALNTLDLTTQAGASAALDSVDAALATVNATRANLGAVQNRFASAVSNLQTSAENMSAARSRIQDADYAQETANLSRSQILQQASTAMVAQANQAPQGVLSLLR